jgi:hypothetical protein
MTQSRFNVKLVVYVVQISRERWPEHPSGKTSDECVFIAYLCLLSNLFDEAEKQGERRDFSFTGEQKHTKK